MILYTILKPIAFLFVKIAFRHRSVGRENVPTQGGCVLASNHMSLLDPVFIAVALKRKVSYMAKAELFDSKIKAWFLRSLGAFPVRRGAKDVAAVKTSLDILEQERAMGIFPQGKRVRGAGVTRYKTGFALISARSGCPVVPVFVISKDQLLRPFRRVTVIFGKPMTAEELGYVDGSSENLQQMAQRLMQEAASLADSAQ